MASLYAPPPRRTRLFSLPSGTTTVTIDLGIASANLATQAADRAVAIESSGRASSDGPVPFEPLAVTSAGATGGRPLTIEASATMRSDRGVAVESLARPRGDMRDPVEWSGAAQFVADALLPLEGAAAVHGKVGAPAEAVVLLLPRTGSAAEWLTAARCGPGSMAEALTALVRGDSGLVEWLATGTRLIADAILQLGWPGTLPASLLSLESGPGRTRLLATPGRVRLVRRS
jgi:hypothetical protein